MKIENKIAQLASLIADTTRSSMLIALMNGKALTAGELALRANISAQTASNHLNKLLKANIITCESTGRHRYYKLISEDIVQVLESLGVAACPWKAQHQPIEKIDPDICFARSCYDHLAGNVGVNITQSLIQKKYIELKDKEFSVTSLGEVFFSELNIDIKSLQQLRRQFSKACLDWTERKNHVAGSLGAALLDYCIKHRLLLRSKKKERVLLLTTEGKLWFKNNLNVEF